MIWVLIYLLGYVVCYYLTRYEFKLQFDWTWSDVCYNCLFSLSSWGGVLVSGIGVLIILGSKRFKMKKSNPPKWL